MNVNIRYPTIWRMREQAVSPRLGIGEATEVITLTCHSNNSLVCMHEWADLSLPTWSYLFPPYLPSSLNLSVFPNIPMYTHLLLLHEFHI